MWSYSSVQFEGNQIIGNIASTISYFYLYDYGLIGRNIFRNNQAASDFTGENAVLSIASNGASVWDIQGNEFTNPASNLEITTFLFSGSNPVDMHVNATSNIFNFEANLTAELIDKKIFDDDEDSSKPEVLFVPFLPANYTPVCEQSCSNQGRCVYPGYCICEEGWGGPACSEPTCQSLNMCSGHGSCIEFDICQCDTDWLGHSCAQANCTAVNHCNGNGFCAMPNVCICATGFMGESCDSCVSNYRKIGESCLECPVCYHGGTCDVCGDKTCCQCPYNRAGDTCLQCQDGYFGSACEPFPYIDWVIPNDAFDEGGSMVRIQGKNFGSINSTITCNFVGVGSVSASFVSSNTVECVTPLAALTSGTLQTALKLFVDGDASFNSVSFAFYGTCPPGQCVNGFCSFGRCQCYFGYRGEACDEGLEAPVLDAPEEPFLIKEGQPFQYQVRLVQGSLPVEWTISGSNIPDSMIIDSATGLLVWDNPAANSNVLSIPVRAQNELAAASEYLRFNVTPSYFVRVSTSTTEMSRPASIIKFAIETVDISNGLPVGRKDAVVWLGKVGSTHKRRFSVKTTSEGSYLYWHLPYGSDAGTFSYGGEHPTYINRTEQGEYLIRAIDVSPYQYFFKDELGENITLQRPFSFAFWGGSYSGIKVETSSVLNLDIGVQLNQNFYHPGATFEMNITLIPSAALNELVEFTLTTDEGLSCRFYMTVDIRERLPKFLAAPGVIEVKVAQNGTAVFREVSLSNIGSRASGLIEVILPNQPILRSISGSMLPGLDVEESRSVSLEFRSTANMNVGDYFYGTMVFKSGKVGTKVDYRATVVSTVPASLTVITQNEASYFAEGLPNLANATVRVQNLVKGTSVTASSGPNGTVEFSDLTEGPYEISK